MYRSQHITAKPKRGTAIVYLIHFNRAYKHARHYLGFSTDLDKRITDHLCGQGARLMEVVTHAGIEWKLARTWRGGRTLERRLKNRKDAPAICPICAGKKALRLAMYKTEVVNGSRKTKGAKINATTNR